MKTKIILGQFIAIAILVFLLFQKPKIFTKTKTVEKIVKVYDTINKTLPAEIKKVYVSVKAKNNKLQKKEARKFIYKDTLKNSYIVSSIFADTIYNRDINVVTINKEKTIETIKINNKPRFYLGGTANGLKSLNSASINAYYGNNRVLIGAGYGFDVNKKQSFIPVTIAFKF
jgi:hypothetical protein